MILKFLRLPVFFGLSFEVYIICFIISIAAFFLLKWGLKRFIKAGKTRAFVAATGALVVTPFCYFALVSLFILFISFTPSRNFDSAKWRDNREDRFQMADDIIKSNLLIGKDTSQVKQILGEPLRGVYKDSYFYDMGYGVAGIGFLFHGLVIKFQRNKVVSVEHNKLRD
jgi:hypothetical protein